LPVPSIISILGISTSSLKWFDNSQTSVQFAIGTTFVNFPFVKTLAHFLPGYNFTFAIKIFKNHIPCNLGLCKCKWSNLNLLDMGWTTVQTPCCIVTSSTSYAIRKLIFHFLDNPSGPTVECLPIYC
jgi:hypothetical protein